MLDIKTQMCELSKKRKVFHSEADFQFALAWQIQKSHPTANIRLEYCPKEFANMHLDILVELDGKNYPIELKYKTNYIDKMVDGEYFRLKKHGATDVGRYDFFADVSRIEKFKGALDNCERGFVVILSNEQSYWSIPKSTKSTVCDLFRIHESRVVSGSLSWTNNPSKGTIKNREKPIVLLNTYNLSWNNYSDIGSERYNIFKYLLLEI